MKTTVNHSHKNSIINYLFFGIAASIFTLSIFFSVYQQEEKADFYKDMSYMVNSRITKPVANTAITETYPVNLKEMFTEAEATITLEPWMSQPFDITNKTIASSATYTEPAIEVETWMTDLNLWNTLPSATHFEEEAMVLESWMLNTNEWAVFSTAGAYANNEFTEEILLLEDWMLSLNSWSAVFNDIDFQEVPLAIENWMLDSSDWLAHTK
ncbi:hypothetical protein [Carboxylicivirga sp. M1479]|uniref:hypothetical protein n=1 Tax=Carboxylicivirga sp. M1479 TaxID=2594476 RepID=UPI00117763FA|nr:hypothetical protein [Carboxylicivirga sp. M1479]TRX70250.1 hypothetical protein FNN09_12250 [Carboxylicivirga sp. M1479]